MKVRELIDILEKVEDKDLECFVDIVLKNEVGPYVFTSRVLGTAVCETSWKELGFRIIA